MAADAPTISAVIPLFNGAEFIVEAVRSVLRQTAPADEVIVVDDGSTDDGPRLLAQAFPDARLTVLTQENKGQSAARNAGAARASGALIAFLDQDDVWYPQHLERLRAPFAEDRPQALGWAYSDLDEIDREGAVGSRCFLTLLEGAHPKRNVIECLRRNMFVLPSATMVSRAAFDAVGGFDERLSGFEDDDLFLRMFRAGYDNVFLPEALTQWRIFPESSSHTPRMARSRMIYARKLIEMFPDQAQRARFFVRDLIAPRFYPEVVDTCRAAIAGGDAAAIRQARADMAFIAGLMPDRNRPNLGARSLLISAVIPLYNGAEFIEGAIRSVFEQTLAPAELIVVDDGSTDGGPEIVEQLSRGLPVSLIRKENGGQSSARNLGVARSHGDYIALLDQDDLWYPNHLEKLAEPFLTPRARDLGWTYSNLDEIDRDGNVGARSFLTVLGGRHPKRDIFTCLRADMFVLPSASLIARRAFDDVGGFDEALSGYEDDDLFLRMFRAGYDNEYVDMPLSRWRIYAGSSSYSPRMARSRAIYAQKLLAEFPDDPDRSRYYTRDMLAPRFVPQMLSDYMKATRTGDPAAVRSARENLLALRKWLGWRHRMVVSAVASPVSAVWPAPQAMVVLARAMRPRWRRALLS